MKIILSKEDAYCLAWKREVKAQGISYSFFKNFESLKNEIERIVHHHEKFQHLGLEFHKGDDGKYTFIWK